MTEPAEAPSAYDLLTKPTLELTDAEVELIVADLQKRRHAYVDSKGKVKDSPKAKAPKGPPLTAEQKAENTARVQALLNLDLDIGDLS